MNIQVTCPWRVEEQKKPSRRTIKEKGVCELDLKGPNLQGRACGKERSRGVQRKRRKRQDLSSKQPPNQERNPAQLGRRCHVGTQTQHHRPLGFQKMLAILLFLCSLAVCEPLNHVCRSNLAYRPPAHKP